MKSSSILVLLAALAASALPPAAIAKIETWSSMDGRRLQAEYVGRKGEYVVFNQADGKRVIIPYATLLEEDRARVDALNLTAPSNGAVVSIPGDGAPSAPKQANGAAAGRIPSAVAGNLVELRKGSLAPVPATQLNGTKYVALYYSAHWCPPCRGFTPELVAAYAKIKASHPEFELIFVSSDSSAPDMQKYMSTYNMLWPAVAFSKIGSIPALARPAHERGIPNLVFMDANGKELAVSYSPSGDYLGPRQVLAKINKHFGL